MGDIVKNRFALEENRRLTLAGERCYNAGFYLGTHASSVLVFYLYLSRISPRQTQQAGSVRTQKDQLYGFVTVH